MYSEKQVIEMLKKFEKTETKFKQLHISSNGKNLLEDFEKDFLEFNNFMHINETNWYSSVADYTYPRIIFGDRSYIIKNGRYHLPFLHLHKFHEFVFVLEGKCMQTVNQERILLKEGDFCYIAPGSVHSIYNNGDDDIVLNMCISAENMGNICALFKNANNCVVKNIVPTGDNLKCSYMLLSDKEKFIKSAIIKTLMLLYEKPDYAPQVLAALLTDIFSFAEIEKVSLKVGEQIKIPEKIVYEIVRYIKENYKELTLEQLSKEFHYTPQYMSKLIHKQTGKTFKELVNGFRVAEACVLLTTTELRVIDVAYEVGFNSAEHFIRVFKKVCKINPNEYKKIKKHQ